MAEAALRHDMGKEAAAVYVDFLVSRFEILYKLSFKTDFNIDSNNHVATKTNQQSPSSGQTKTPSASPTKEEKPLVSFIDH